MVVAQEESHSVLKVSAIMKRQMKIHSSMKTLTVYVVQRDGSCKSRKSFSVKGGSGIIGDRLNVRDSL